MSLEEFTPSVEDSGEAGGKSAESVRESDPVRVARTLRNIKKTRRDEQKSRRDDDSLARVLLALMQTEEYHFLLSSLVPLISSGVPSHFLVGWLSLIFEPAERTIRVRYTSVERADAISPVCESLAEHIEFDEEALPQAVRDRINFWIDDLFDAVTHDPSNIITKKLLTQLETSAYRRMMTDFVRDIFEHFLFSLRIRISESRAHKYSDFILKQLAKRLESVYDAQYFEG